MTQEARYMLTKAWALNTPRDQAAGEFAHRVGELASRFDGPVVILVEHDAREDAVAVRVYANFDELHPLAKILRGVGRRVWTRLRGIG